MASRNAPPKGKAHRRQRRRDESPIDWERIKIYCRRGKEGTASAAEHVACEEAWRRDPETYSRIKAEANAEVDEEMRMRWG